MNFQLSEDQSLSRNMVRTFAQAELVPRTQERDEEDALIAS